MTPARHAGPEANRPNTSWFGRTTRLLVALVLSCAVVAFVVVRFQLTDAYRPGTIHRVEVLLNGCDRPGSLWLEQRSWSSHNTIPDRWPNPSMSSTTPTPIAGTLEVTDRDLATFTADQGGTVHFVRLAPNRLPDLVCPIS